MKKPLGEIITDYGGYWCIDYGTLLDRPWQRVKDVWAWSAKDAQWHLVSPGSQRPYAYARNVVWRAACSYTLKIGAREGPAPASLESVSEPMCQRCHAWYEILADAGRDRKRSMRLPWVVAAAAVLALWAAAGTVAAVTRHTGDDLRAAAAEAHQQGYEAGKASLERALWVAEARNRRLDNMVDCIEIEVETAHPAEVPHIPDLIDEIRADCASLWLEGVERFAAPW